jgi:hypothetical protein
MSHFPLSQVQSDIDTLRQSFSYDPIEAWLPAYDRLHLVQSYLFHAGRTYAWVAMAGVVIAIALFVIAIYVGTDTMGVLPWLASLFLGIPAIAQGSIALASYLARRDEPLLTHRYAIDEACKVFDELAPNSKDQVRHDPA